MKLLLRFATWWKGMATSHSRPRPTPTSSSIRRTPETPYLRYSNNIHSILTISAEDAKGQSKVLRYIRLPHNIPTKGDRVFIRDLTCDLVMRE